MTALKKLAALTAAAAVSLGVAAAHPGHGPEAGVLAGVAHYFSGLDHIIGSIAAGLVGAALTRRAGGALLWLAGFAVLFGLYHEVAFFHDFEIRGFDIGFMGSALSVMLAVFGATKLSILFHHRQRSAG